MRIELPKQDPVIERARRYPEYLKIYAKLREYVKKILDRHEIEPTKATLRRKGISSFVLVLEGKKKLALKISPRYSLYTEVYFFKKAKSAGFPVPKVIEADATKKLIPYDFHITDWIEGKAPDELREKDLYACAFKLGCVFARMHKIRLRGFGFPKPGGKWSHRSWRSALKDFIYRETSWHQIQKLFGNKVANMTRQIMSDKKMNIKTPSLIHGDTGEDQFVVEKRGERWIIRGILDPSDFISGDPMMDIASSMITWNKKAYRKGFYDGYVSLHAFSKDEQYRLHRLLFLNQVWAASVVYQTNKRDGKGMVEDAVRLAKNFDFPPV